VDKPRRSVALSAVVCAALFLPGLGAAQGTERTVPAEDTAAAVVDPAWTVPRTSWGQPSFEGVWSVDDMLGIPRQRPEEFGLRDKLTPEEFAARAAADDAQRNFVVNEQAFSGRREYGTRTFGYTSLVVDPPNGRYPPLTESGRARAAAVNRGTFGPGPFDDFGDFTLYDRCITRGIFGSVLPAIYGNGIRITQSPGTFAITYEMIHETRIIPLDGRAHVAASIRPYTGNGRGYWDGDTLVVETTNFTDKTGVGVGGAHSDQLQLRETYTRVDPQMIEYTATIDDPVTFTVPFTYRVMFTTTPGYQLYEYSCHEGNSAIDHSLSGERAYEKRVAEAVAQGLPLPERIPSAETLELPEDRDSIEFFDINAGE
jgi:hypothetical protein